MRMNIVIGKKYAWIPDSNSKFFPGLLPVFTLPLIPSPQGRGNMRKLTISGFAMTAPEPALAVNLCAGNKREFLVSKTPL